MFFLCDTGTESNIEDYGRFYWLSVLQSQVLICISERVNEVLADKIFFNFLQHFHEIIGIIRPAHGHLLTSPFSSR
jgi:hypothetical protein